MKISELIAELDILRGNLGDLNVVVMQSTPHNISEIADATEACPVYDSENDTAIEVLIC